MNPRETVERANQLLGTPERPRARALRMADVEPEAVEFLWAPYIPLRKLTLLEGDPGEGKTWLALALSAAVSRGDPMPGHQGRQAPGSVLFWSAEDGVADTLRPRLDSAGASVENVYALVPADETRDFLTLADTHHIEAVIEEVRPRLLVVDPIQAALGPEVDAHRANEVRPRLALLKSWAERYDMAVLVIRHLSKAPTTKAIHRGLGSIDFSAAARSVLLLGKLPDDEARRAVVQVKNSVGPHGEALEFTIEDGTLRWLAGPSTVTASTLFAPESSDDERSALEEAVEFLTDALAVDDRPVADVEKDARKHGIADRTLRRARERLGVKARKEGRVWIWPKLPIQNNGQDGQDGYLIAGAAFNHVGQPGQEKVWPGSAPVGEMPEEAANTPDMRGAIIDRGTSGTGRQLHPAEKGGNHSGNHPGSSENPSGTRAEPPSGTGAVPDSKPLVSGSGTTPPADTPELQLSTPEPAATPTETEARL